LFFLKNTSF